MVELEALEDWVAPLLQRIEPAERIKLARTIARQLRRSQQQRVAGQRNPDGSPYTPRKPRQLRSKKGRVQRSMKMFRKMRTATYLKAQGNATGTSVGFAGRIARIARVHQKGLRDRATDFAPSVRYERRELLGLTRTETGAIKDLLIGYLLD